MDKNIHIDYTYHCKTFWCDDALQNKKNQLVNMVCFHQSMFRWGNWEPGNYTNIIPFPKYMFSFMFIKIFAHLAQSLEHLSNFVVMTFNDNASTCQ